MSEEKKSGGEIFKSVTEYQEFPGISGNLVVKSKLPPQSGSSLEAVEPHP